MLKKIRFFLWGVVFVAVCGFVFAFFKTEKDASPEKNSSIKGLSISPHFHLTDHHGVQRSADDFKDMYMLIYFGYSFCPDICPTGLFNISEALKMIGKTADKIQPLFISVDPKRDTPEHLALYMQNYHPKFLGLTGTPQQVDAAKKAFHVYAAEYHEKGEPETTNYLVDHSSIVYLVGPDGKLLANFTHATPSDEIAKVLKSTISGA